MGQPTRWPHAHLTLQKLYDARVPKDMTQKDFGAKYGIGTQPMVWQYLNGHRPLNYDAAAKFARGLGCTIYDISPEMAEELQTEILPVLGKALRRAAMFAALAVLPALTPSPSDARPVAHNPLTNCVLCKLIQRIIAAFLLEFFVIACSTIDEHTEPPKDWPELTIHEHRVPHAEMRDQCARFTGAFSSPEACAIVRFDLLRCDIYFSADFPPMQSVVAHEYKHCAGYDHPGEETLAEAWRLHKAGAAGKAIADSLRKL